VVIKPAAAGTAFILLCSVLNRYKFYSFFSPKVSDVVTHAKFKIASLLKTVLKHFADEGLSFRPSRRGNKRLV